MSKEKFIKDINNRLNEIFNDRTLSPEDRGELGEQLVYEVAKYWGSRYEKFILESSFMYEQGPIFPTMNSQEDKPVTESDIVLVTPYAVFVLEVKTVYGEIKFYENLQMEISHTGKFTGETEGKNYLRQNEMHCRHLYYHLKDVLPDGDPRYIKPLIVMTGKTKVIDERKVEDKRKYPILVTNSLIPVLEKLNRPRKYLLNVDRIKAQMEKVRVTDKNRLLNSQKFN